jgi:N6-adenosine-specific RNA methylase IME4
MGMLHEATVYLERVRQTLLEADRFADILHARSLGELYRQYARQRRYGIDIQNTGAEIKLRAERRAGALLRLLPKNSGQLFRGDTMIPRENIPTYDELDLDKQQASRWQRASALPEALFEAYIAETKARHQALTSAAVLALAKAHCQAVSPETPRDLSPTASDPYALSHLIDAGASFRTIYVDPPYGAMSLQDIAALPVRSLAAADAHVHLWTSTAFLFDAKAILEAWGFAYQSTFVWVTPFPGASPYWRQSHAFLLLGVRGTCPFREGMRSWVEAPAEPDGGKPEVIRQMIERVSPSPYLELFGQHAVPHWTIWHPDMGCVPDGKEDEGEPLCPEPSHSAAASGRKQATSQRADPTPPAQSDVPETVVLPLPAPGDFHLPPALSSTKEALPDGMAYVFRHDALGMLGRIVLQDRGESQCHVSLEVAGDPEDPMTARRLAVFEPVANALTRRLERQHGRIEEILGAAPPLTLPNTGEIVESKLMQCEQCDAGVALLIFAPEATDPGRFEDYARRMYRQVVQMNVPTYVIGPALGDGPLMDRPADILKIWPEREPMQRLRPDEFNPLLDQLALAHCRDSSARRVLEQMRASGELSYRGTRRHRGNLCKTCFFYRRISHEDEACDSYEKWLVDPPVKRETCEYYISR